VCEIEGGPRAHRGLAIGTTPARLQERVHARVIVAAHGSWEREPPTSGSGSPSGRHRAHHDSDLLAFKANFNDASLLPGTLAVLALSGGYGGMVVANGKTATLACCVRRDALRKWRRPAPELPAGLAVEAHLRQSCRGVGVALAHAIRVGPWLSAGPIRPGIRVWEPDGVFRVGNAAGETHPLIGEGISMALQSAVLLSRHLLRVSPRVLDRTVMAHLKTNYAREWCDAFTLRMRIAKACSYIAMHTPIAVPTGIALHRWPNLLTKTASWAGKARPVLLPTNSHEGIL
jgi:2-polyprenyl-6-methoxyphenol hydroxylase-like FAD-dependent oxidoreductase